jgi:predicted transposase
MKTVRVIKIVSDDETLLHSLDELMRVFCSAKRYVFNRLLEGRNAKVCWLNQYQIQLKEV